MSPLWGVTCMAGYFDEAAAHGSGLGGHGLVRFGTDSPRKWHYPFNSDLPAIWDCLALNVIAEQEWAYIDNRPNVSSASTATTPVTTGPASSTVQTGCSSMAPAVRSSAGMRRSTTSSRPSLWPLAGPTPRARTPHRRR
jgi:hypothetical protein